MSLEIGEVYPSKYLAANDLNGRPRTVVITGATKEMLGQGDQAKEKLVLAISTPKGEPIAKRFVAGKMVSRAIADLLGSTDAAKWIGKQIELRPESVYVGSKLTPCIRPYPVRGRFDDLVDDTHLIPGA
jgi:hypothetical protein